MTVDAWSEELSRYLREVRARDPIPARSSLSAAQEFQCRILGGHLLRWLREWGPELIGERNALPITRGATTEPLVVFATDTPGIVAALEILGDRGERVVFCRATELAAFPGYEEDATFRFHCELHSYFDGPGNADVHERARVDHPRAGDEEIWLHYDCTVMGPLHAQGSHHVWFWNGREPRLIAEGWNVWIS